MGDSLSWSADQEKDRHYDEHGERINCHNQRIERVAEMQLKWMKLKDLKFLLKLKKLSPYRDTVSDYDFDMLKAILDRHDQLTEAEKQITQQIKDLAK